MRAVHILKITAIAGAESHLLLLLAGLRQRGVGARFLVMVEPTRPMDDFMDAAAQQGIPAERHIIRHHTDVTLHPRIWRRMRSLKPDIVHTHLQHGDLYGIPAAWLARVPVVITSRHNNDPRRQWKSLQFVNRTLWRLVDAGICISDANKAFSIAVEDAPADRLHTIHYGLELPQAKIDRPSARQTLRRELGAGDNALLIGMVCRLIEIKGIPYTLRAFHRIANAFPAARLVIAGDGPLRESIEAEAKALGIADRVHLLGWRDDIPRLMAAYDVLVVSSFREGFGLVMLEAMAQQIPVIGTNVSAIPEVIVDGETGRLVPPGDIDALADVLGQILADNALRQHMGFLGEDRLETHFSASRMVDETIALYRRLLSDKGRQGETSNDS
jgi:glycosyltransferase involved in cell wall biosynthesis